MNTNRPGLPDYTGLRGLREYLRRADEEEERLAEEERQAGAEPLGPPPFVPCPDCNGTGETECECGECECIDCGASMTSNHEHECETCGGDGHVDGVTAADFDPVVSATRQRVAALEQRLWSRNHIPNSMRRGENG